LGWEHILSALYLIIFIGKCLQLIYLILKEEHPGIIKKYETENCKKVNTIFYTYTMSKNFKCTCFTELSFIKIILEFGSPNANSPLKIIHRSLLACGAQLCYCHSLSAAPYCESQQK